MRRARASTPRLRTLLVAAALALAGCADDPAPARHGLRYDGPLGTPVEAALAAGALAVPVAVDGVAGPALLVDTGSPLTLVNPAAFPGARVPAGAGVVPSLGVGALTLRDVPVVGADPFGAGELGGVLGADVLCQFASTFDHRARRLTLGPAPAVAGVAAPVTLPFRLAGGGVAALAGGAVAFGPTRVAVTATVEGASLRLVVDTGASFVALRRSRVARLAADGRGARALPASTAGGVADTVHVRLRAVALGDAVATEVVAAGLDDAALDDLAGEVGHPVDGLLGVTFLREFLVTVDYPGRALVLRRYADRAHVADEFRRVGVVLGAARDGARWRHVVARVFAGTDAAAQGLAAGAAVAAVEGRDAGALDPPALDRLLRGAPGDTRALTVGGRDVRVRVDELLPLP